MEPESDNLNRGALSAPSPDPWEAAYLRFETPKQEVQKFVSRLRRLGAAQWPRNAEIVELFCGRGNGLNALERLGFTHIEGVDLSPRLIAQYRGPAKCIVADCRKLPFADRSKDILIVQGGLHHLPALPGDLDQTFSEMQRVLRNDGCVVLVEPWLTPFLQLVHAVSETSFARRLSNRMDALATMIHFERRPYEQWLGQPALIQKITRAHFVPVHESFPWDKWNFVGAPRLRRSNHITSNSPLPACIFSSPRYDGCVSQSLRDLTLPELSAASSAASPAPAVSRGRLLQVLGMWFGMAVAIGNAIAAGIVRTPGEIAKILPNPWLFIGVWG